MLILVFGVQWQRKSDFIQVKPTYLFLVQCKQYLNKCNKFNSFFLLVLDQSLKVGYITSRTYKLFIASSYQYTISVLLFY